MFGCRGVLVLALVAAAAPLERRARGGPSDGTSLLQVEVYNSSQSAIRKASKEVEVHNSSQKAIRRAGKEVEVYNSSQNAQRVGRSLFPKCEDLLYYGDIWGVSARGFDLTYYTGQTFDAGELQWIGCSGGNTGCPVGTFFCSQTSGEGIEFGTTSHLPLRARLGVDDPHSSHYCATAANTNGVSEALDGKMDARALCVMLGFADGFVTLYSRSTISGDPVCPAVTQSDTGEWDLTFEPRTRFTTRVRCIEISTTTSTTTVTETTVTSFSETTFTRSTRTSMSYTSHTHTSVTPTTVTTRSTSTSTQSTTSATTSTKTLSSTTTTTSTGIITCSSLMTTMKVWGHNAIGMDVGRFLPSLRWLGCVETVSDDPEYQCQPADFYCSDLTTATGENDGIQFGTNAENRPMRALLGPVYFRNTSVDTGCASAKHPRNVLSAFGTQKDVKAFCEQLGYNADRSQISYGTVAELQCPRILFQDGVGIRTWTTDYQQRQTFARKIVCRGPLNPYR